MITVGDAWKDLRDQQMRQAEMAGLAEKRRKHQARREEWEGHDMRGEALTSAHEADRAGMAAECAGQGRCEDGPMIGDGASKGVGHLEAEPGPGHGMAPQDMPDASRYSRPYLDAGHSAPSPMHQPPNAAPMPPEGRGILTPLEMAAAPVVAGNPGPMTASMAAHQAKAQMRPLIPRGSA